MFRFFSIGFVVALVTLFCGNRAWAGSLDPLSYDEKVVAITILAEAKGEGEVGMRAVACVIQQRSIERKKSVAVICLQPKQFSCWNGMTVSELSAKAITRKTPKSVVDVAIALAKDLVAEKQLDRSLVGYANHYHTLEVKPSWSRGVTPVVIIGNHKFFKI
jgi:spore germination cell wall hydrolase CwlJ-like protein